MTRSWIAATVALVAVLVFPAHRCMAAGFGTLSNFDVVNDTSGPCHGFEIELEDIHSSDVPYTFGGSYIRYDVPEVLDVTVDPAHPRVLVRYRHWNGTQWEATPVAPPNLTPGGHDCFASGPIGNYQDSGCEHFGVSLSASPTRTTYRWLVATDPTDPNTVFTVVPEPVNIPVPVWSVAPIPVAAGGGVNVRAEVEPVEEENHARFGEPQWMKVFKIETELDLQPEDLVRLLLGADNAILPGETEVETEWKLIQSKPGDAEGENEDADVKEDPLDRGKHSVVRRYEFYEYTGPRDPENDEAVPCIDDGAPVPADAPVEGCSDLGAFVGAQNVAADVDLIATDSQLPIGEVGVPYAGIAVVIGGLPPYAVTVIDNTAPDGLAIEASTGVLSGRPTTEGDFSFTIEATDSASDTARETFAVSILPELVIDTAALPVAVAGECYAASVTAIGGLAPYSWQEIRRDLPDWADTENSNDIEGCPRARDEGVTHITFRVTDALGGSDSKTLDLMVAAEPIATPTSTPEPTSTPTPTQIVSPTETATEPPTPTPTMGSGVCIGNCNGDASVNVDELVTMVGIALDMLPPSVCIEGLPGDATMNVAILVRAVDNALGVCPSR